MTTTTILLKVTTPMVCGGCTGTVERALQAVPGVTAASVGLDTHVATVEVDETACPCSKHGGTCTCTTCTCVTDALVAAVAAVGFDAGPTTTAECATADRGPCGKATCTCGKDSCQCGPSCSCAGCGKNKNNTACGKSGCTCGPDCNCGTTCTCASCLTAGEKSCCAGSGGPCGKPGCTCGPNCKCGSNCTCADCGSQNKKSCCVGTGGPCGKFGCTCGPMCQCGSSCSCGSCTIWSVTNLGLVIALFSLGFMTGNKLARK